MQYIHGCNFREEDDREEGVERGQQGDGEGGQHRLGERPQPDRETPPQCQEDANAIGEENLSKL